TRCLLCYVSVTSEQRDLHSFPTRRSSDLGEEEFIAQAKKIKRYGAAVIVMAFDEVGQADNFERRIEIAKRSYDILTQKVNFPPEDRKSTRLNSSHVKISYAVFCLKKNKKL